MLTFLRQLFWSRCERHGVAFNTDLCPYCVRERFARTEDEPEHGVETSLHVRRMLAAKDGIGR